MPPLEHSDTINFSSRFPITTSLSDSLIFIKFIPENTLRRIWYLIQVDMDSITKANADYVANGKYWCVFLSWHPDDSKQSDDFSSWWPYWCRYTLFKS